MQRKALMGVSECEQFLRQHYSAIFENGRTVARMQYQGKHYE